MQPWQLKCPISKQGRVTLFVIMVWIRDQTERHKWNLYNRMERICPDSPQYRHQVCLLISCALLGEILHFLAHLSRRLEWAIVIAHRPASVRRPSSSSVRKLFTFSTSSPEPLDGFWWNLVGMKYSWSLTSVVVFRPDPLMGWSRAGPK